MNNIASLKTLLIVEPKKRIGTISEVSSGYAIITDFLNRTFKATIPENLDLIFWIISNVFSLSIVLD